MQTPLIGKRELGRCLRQHRLSFAFRDWAQVALRPDERLPQRRFRQPRRSLGMRQRTVLQARRSIRAKAVKNDQGPIGEKVSAGE